MVTYIMDTLRWKEAALASVWLTLVAANIGFLVSAALRREGYSKESLLRYSSVLVLL